MFCFCFLYSVPLNGLYSKKQNEIVYRHASFYHALQILPFFFFFLNKLKVCGNSVPSKFVGSIFPTALTNCISVCHILVILTVFLFHYYYIFTVICDQASLM